ncbi:2-C-methyl-D-erythritol 2,4-cyclodiphosphate synthase [Solimonas aquatica]|uniref:2-C-methyl-D-erythritol 2,4-cyclodiphosphate synthase n=1 Tax=Solimonas aquatica TaxID=489703 RepID=A0A1H9AIQ5_9GAMM|nr:2-C-methyl-D-erythritol 2,4-cyclodiphosphate synthase [Solimonas aquatica]SEP76361.1 2-C-methyl-D-erythritol 2,4-cyclodiphosphate synthase [Solimonas aquatica]
MKLRIGHGFDTHRLEAGEGVHLGGVFIACPYRIIAHSDGDVLIHALCDALLGALAMGDIGKLFPDNDARFAGIDSRELLAEVMRRVREAGYGVINADLSLIAQVPRVAPHVLAMRQQLAQGLGVAADAVSVKATTNEGLDAIGRKEGLSAHAVVLLGGA